VSEDGFENKVCGASSDAFKIFKEITALGLHRKVGLMFLFSTSSWLSGYLWTENCSWKNKVGRISY
jgi:hypothetical protein